MIDLTEKILYEDEHIMAIDKPSGLVVHPDGRTTEPSVSEWLSHARPETKEVGEPITLNNGVYIERPGIVHRIDRDTSGVLLLAKTVHGHGLLKKQFQERQVEKIYHLFVYGLIKEDHGSLTLPIGRSASNSRKWSAQRGARGELRDALTYFHVLKRAEDKSATFVEARPKTGRTHQIRVHFQAYHHAVVADPLYAATKPAILGFERLALHARSIKFRNTDKQEITVEAPYPEDFKRAIDTI